MKIRQYKKAHLPADAGNAGLSTYFRGDQGVTRLALYIAVNYLVIFSINACDIMD